MTKHTPGPWKFAPMFRDDPNGRQLVREDGTGFAIAETFLPANSRAKHIDPKANAQLIAAAPDMLDAVTALLMWIAECDHGSEYKANMHKPVAVAKARDALRKAGTFDTVAARVSAMAGDPTQ